MNLERSADASWAGLGCLASGGSYFAGEPVVGVINCLPARVALVFQPLLVNSGVGPLCRGCNEFARWPWDP